ncbi:hypothetical protein SAMN04489725_11723 [Alicyclobacillus hesperidum]|uniref:WD40 repeat n=1 Tax=Alicyclobacillus hesperidum TaxID=89784 RepID=A0A1H2WX05_9BACL|nr:WD40 repeat domain-containing protein [Alicyclobacillus hesperidum]SDW85132.1 hypothetical protein SAMN04489725_11723 [Alicyclobacillus hesperidum]
MRGTKPAMRLCAALCAMMIMVAGCDTTNRPQQSETENALPARVQPGALVAGGSTVVAEFVHNKWIYLPAASVVNAPSSAFQTVDVSATGEVAATTPGNGDTLTGGSSGSALWLYQRGWRPVEIQGDANVQVHAFAPDGTLYAATDDGQLAGLWKRTNEGWTQVPGTTQMGYITSILWSPKGTLTVVSIPDNGATTIWQQIGQKWIALGGENAPFAGDTLTIQWSPSGQLTVGSSGHGAFTYENGTWTPAGGVPTPISDVQQIGWSPEGNLYVAGHTSGSTGLWELSGGHWHEVNGLGQAVGHDKIREFGWSPQGVLTVSDGTACQLFQLQSGRWVCIWNKTKASDPDALPPYFAWSPQGTLVCDGGDIGGLWQETANGSWTLIGGNQSPFRGQRNVSFTWAPADSTTS